MVSRDDREPNRVSSPLELLFDLVFVVAVSQASQSLSTLLAQGAIWQGVVSYLMVFFAVWWAWMNFTWFASAFDTDDWLYRLMTIVQMGGALVLAGGVQDAMVDGNAVIAAWGYVIMRLAMVGQWLRAYTSDPSTRATSLRYAVGITVIQLLWIGRVYLLDAQWQLWSFLVLAASEVALPIWAERPSPTRPNPRHIAERYGLFTLILLGGSLLVSATAIIDALHTGRDAAAAVGLAAVGLIVVAGMWWVYFAGDNASRLSSPRASFVFGYGHYAVFAAAGAASSGFEITIAEISGKPPLPVAVAGLALSVPLAVYFAGVWALLLRRALSPRQSVLFLTIAGVMGASGLWNTFGLLLVAAMAGALVALIEVTREQRSRAERSEASPANRTAR